MRARSRPRWRRGFSVTDIWREPCGAGPARSIDVDKVRLGLIGVPQCRHRRRSARPRRRHGRELASAAMWRRSCASSAARWSRPGTASALACDQSEFGAAQRAAQRRGPEFGTASATEVLLGLGQNGLAGGLARPSPRFGVTWPPGEVRAPRSPRQVGPS